MSLPPSRGLYSIPVCGGGGTIRCPPPLPSAVTGAVATDEDGDNGDDGVFGASYTTRERIGVDSEVE